jgi:hypothetical protein
MDQIAKDKVQAGIPPSIKLFRRYLSHRNGVSYLSFYCRVSQGRKPASCHYSQAQPSTVGNDCERSETSRFRSMQLFLSYYLHSIYLLTIDWRARNLRMAMMNVY